VIIIGRSFDPLQVEPRIEQTFKNPDPWLVFAMVKREGEEASRFLGRVFGTKEIGVTVLERQSKPDVEEIGHLRIVQKTLERRICDNQVDRGCGNALQVGRRSAFECCRILNRITAFHLLALSVGSHPKLFDDIRDYSLVDDFPWISAPS
jgi:hypothetical protein